ncbi:DUF6443 domain-containing protein [Hymenobacter sp. BT635]|uniref:DUF6443 domain-containing protein n=1 Tax=Hymenobacter nitidus TaxID=2880929 RepID=A0ABS8AHP9_9BACT|nr:DUF6443 domain-containing protein [Hymenobacter nitidus]MCB2379963.1 DUF6443 domain-containing protein [Hymenobacter nitidus]
MSSFSAVFVFLGLLFVLYSRPGQAQRYEGLVPDSTELRVLHQFYYATNGPEWTDQTRWLDGTTVAEAATWYGVQANDYDIISLQLPGNKLVGELPASIQLLIGLQHLNLSGNTELGGPIPDGFGHSQLSTLNLSNCQIRGQIPASIGLCRNLRVLNLSSNQIRGSILTEIGNLPLYYLLLSDNRLTQGVPAALGRITSLVTLDLRHNLLTGSLPDSLGYLTNLTYCFLDHNKLRGEIPASLGACPNLTQLDMSHNEFTGALPESFTAAPRLYWLGLSHNELTSIPSWAGKATIPGFLLVQYNYLTIGSIEANYQAAGVHWPQQFEFEPQLTRPADTIKCLAGTTKILHRSMPGQRNHYQWERQIGGAWVDVPAGRELPVGQDTLLTLAPITTSDAGLYRLRVWNSWVTRWGRPVYLYTRPQYVKVAPYNLLAENLPVNGDTGYTLTAALIPPVFAGSPDSLQLNYVRTYSAREAITNPGQLVRTNVDSVQVKTDYLDGLGRPIQTILRQESPLRRDIVQPIAYDALGRQPKSYLPYTATNSTRALGDYRPNALREQYEFYHDAPVGRGAPTEGLARTGVPYTETAFDASPLNKIVAQAAPGEAWQMATDHVVVLNEHPNTGSENVYNYTGSRWDRTPIIYRPGFYGPGKLWVKETRDENHARTLQFQDSQGQVILKRVESTIPGKASQWLDTYYVFDYLNHLRLVLPPKAEVLLRTQNWQMSPAIEQLLFGYRYDGRGRIIAKQIPGTQGETQLVYDELDRVILSQDAVQRARQQWAFTKYDALGRPILTGLCRRNAGRDSLQAEAGRTLVQHENRTAAGPHYYTLSESYPQLASTSLFTQPQVLTVTYYDDYNFDNDIANTPDAAYDTQYNSQFTTGPVPQADSRVTGQVTRTKVRVLNVPESAAGAWLTTTSFYDARSRPIQVRGTNARGGEDITTTQVDFAGKVLKSYSVHSDPRSLPIPVTIAESFAYDHAGRLLTNTQQLSGETQPTVLATLRYNELGQLRQKQLGLGKQSLDYQYNIRGWLTHLNNVAQRDPNDLWGMELYYNYGFTRDYRQYNGNITGQKWRSKSDTITRAYGYIYDSGNRLLQGDFVARAASGAWTAEKQNYGLHYVSYDENGNILTMHRHGLVAASTRTTPKQYGTIDQLTYAYQGNQLTSVNDAIRPTGSREAGTVSLAGDFQDASTSTTQNEYTYDNNGNLTADYNKGITNIAYNHLNLPQRIAFGNDSIVFHYTAVGQKVSKLVYQGSKPVQQTDYAGSFQYEQDSLRFFPHSEGRVLRFVNLDNAGQPQVRYSREFSLKDHLGNLRVAYRSGDSAAYVATMEPTPAAVARREEHQFDSVSIVSTRFYAGMASRTGSYVARLNAALGQPLGPIKMLRVQKGDTVHIMAPGMYTQEVRNANYTFSLLSFVASLLQNQSTTFQGPELSHKLKPLPFLGLSLSMLPLLQQNGRIPKGYVRLLVFNKDSVLIDNRTQQLTSAALNSYEPLHLSIVAPTDGYVQAYVGNDSDVDVFFDDVEVKYNPTLLVQENHYDPWGLNLAGIERSSGALENKFQYTGKEKQLELGLNWQDYGARMYDAQLGRWHSIDLSSEKYYSWTPYNFVANNPLLLVDLDGKDWFYYKAQGATDAGWHWQNGNKYEHKYKDKDGKSQSTTITGTQAAVVFNGSRYERLGTNSKGEAGYIDGNGAITASVTVYGPNGKDDIHTYTGYTMSSDANAFGAIDEGTYNGNYDSKGKSGALTSNWALANRGHVRMLDGALNPFIPSQTETNGEGYKDGIFIHTTNKNGFAGAISGGKSGISVGCLLISPSDWKDFNKSMSGVKDFKVQVIRQMNVFSGFSYPRQPSPLVTIPTITIHKKD